MSKKINTEHFSTMEGLLKHLKQWERDDDIDAYYRFFSPSCAFELANKIEKQQKKIEENQVLIDDIKEHRIVYIDTPEFEEKFISKDKIREKIKHYNNELEHIKNGEEFENEKPMYYWGKVALENLLEEN
jgi:hypothetical protein